MVPPQNRRKKRELYWPVFTVLHSSAQLFMFAWVSWHVGVTTFGLVPEKQLRLEPITLKGPIYVKHTRYPNPWFGPTVNELIHYGTLYPPCIRVDYRYNYAMAMKKPSRGQLAKMGCCELPTMNVAMTTTQDDCMSAVNTNSTMAWKPVLCSQRPMGENFVAHVIRPCCVSLNNKCIMTSPQHCWFLQGVYQYHADHCSQVDCLRGRCSYGGDVQYQDYGQHFYLPNNYNQWWRLVSCIYVSQGLIDGIVIGTIGFVFGVHLEKRIGWLRMALIQTTAGVGGHLFGSLLSSSTSPISGAGPSVAGMLAVNLMSILKDWKLITRPQRSVCACSLSLVFVILFGTFPRMNLFSNLGGLILGLSSGFIYLSYPKKVTYSCCLLIVLAMLICLFSFYEVQSHCESCERFVCSLYSLC